MYRLVVMYHTPEDASAFDRHYTDTHVTLATQIPGLRSFRTTHCSSLDGSAPVYFMLAQLEFDSAEDMAAGMGSPQGQAAVADAVNFATAGFSAVHGEDADRL